GLRAEANPHLAGPLRRPVLSTGLTVSIPLTPVVTPVTGGPHDWTGWPGSTPAAGRRHRYRRDPAPLGGGDPGARGAARRRPRLDLAGAGGPRRPARSRAACRRRPAGRPDRPAGQERARAHRSDAGRGVLGLREHHRELAAGPRG